MDAILGFHSIDDTGSVLSYPPGELARLLDGLLAEGVRFVRLRALLEPADDERPRVALTFDDGMKSVHAAVLGTLLPRALPCAVFVVSEWVGRDNRWPSQPATIPRFELMGWDELSELCDAGVEIGGHTANHVALAAIPGKGRSDAAWITELRESKERIQERLGCAVESFAYPYGSLDDESVARVGALHAQAVTTRMSYLPPLAERVSERMRLPRLDAYYLRPATRALPLFGRRVRAWLAARALLRGVKATLIGRGVQGGGAYGA